MPIFHFHVGGDLVCEGDEGIELNDLAAAKCEAVKLCGRIICDTAGAFWESSDLVMNVTNDAGLVLFYLHFVGVEAPASRAYPRLSA